MDSSNVLNPPVRVKKEPLDEPLNHNNDYEIIDTIPVTQHVKYERFWQENSMLQKFAKNHENELDDLEIEMECTDMKPNLLAVAKIENYSPNQWPDSDEYKAGSSIKLETVRTRKEEILTGEETDLNFGRELSEKKEKGNVSRKVETRQGRWNYKHRLKTQAESARNGNITPACDVCGKSFRYKSHLQKHIDSVHHKIRHACDICRKTFTQKSNLKNHINSLHRKITHPCDVCQKTFSEKGSLKIHIDSIHNGVSHPCDICKKLFKKKCHLKVHIESVHNGVSHACDVCGKTFTTKYYIQNHMNAVHNGIVYTCDMCIKKFTVKSSLKAHIDAEHNGITHACDFCEKKFKYQTQLHRHVKSLHNIINYSCKTCEKTFGQKRNLKAHIDVAHRSRNQT